MNKSATELESRSRGKSVTAKNLSRRGSGILSSGFLHERSIADCLLPDEQPHYHFYCLTGEITRDGVVSTDEKKKYRSSLLITDQRILLLIGDKKGDRGEAISYSSVLRAEFELNTLTCKFTVYTEDGSYSLTLPRKVDEAELRSAKMYIESRADADIFLDSRLVSDLEPIWNYSESTSDDIKDKINVSV